MGIAVEFAATLVPSWTRVESTDTGTAVALITQSAGFHPLFQPPTRGLSQATDFCRLGLMWLLIALGCAFVWVWVSRPEPVATPGPDQVCSPWCDVAWGTVAFVIPAALGEGAILAGCTICGV